MYERRSASSSDFLQLFFIPSGCYVACSTSKNQGQRNFLILKIDGRGEHSGTKVKRGQLIEAIEKKRNQDMLGLLGARKEGQIEWRLLRVEEGYEELFTGSAGRMRVKDEWSFIKLPGRKLGYRQQNMNIKVRGSNLAIVVIQNLHKQRLR